MLEQLIQPITGPYSHSGFGDFISIKLVTLGYTSAFKSSRESTRASLRGRGLSPLFGHTARGEDRLFSAVTAAPLPVLGD